MKYILALDQSTSATKTILFNLKGEVIDKTSAEHQQIYPKPGWVEHDPEEIYQNTIEVTKKLLERNPSIVPEILCVSITNQRETIAVFERGRGRPLYNAIVWQCRRGEEICRRLSEKGLDELVFSKTGLNLDTYFSGSKLKWLFEQHPEVKEAVSVGNGIIGTIDAYLIYRLTKGKTFATDHSNASRTLLYNIHQLNWDAELCEIFSVPMESLGEIRDCSANFGETDLEGCLDQPIPITGVIGDSQGALFAQQCFEMGSAKVTFGTGSSVLMNIGGKPLLAGKGIVTALAWVLKQEPVYAFEGITNFTGGTIAWLKDNMQIIQSAAESETLANSIPDNGGVYLVPAFVGLGAPYWRPEAKACITGLSPSSGNAHIVRAGLEGIAYRIQDVLEAMNTESGLEINRIQADGGATANQFLMQFSADISGVEIAVSNIPELSALGAAQIGALGIDIFSSIDDLPSLVDRQKIYRPEMDADERNSLLEGWKKAVAKTICT